MLHPSLRKVLDQGRFIRTAHRGFPPAAKGNSGRAITAALDFAVDLVEIDVHSTSDGHLILWHDDDCIDRQGRRWVLAQSTLAQIQSIDIGDGQGILTLAQGMELVRGRAGLMIDLKAPGLGSRIVEQVRTQRFEPAVVCGGYKDTLEEIQRLAPELGTSLTLTQGWQQEYGLASVSEIDFDMVTVDGRLMNPEFLRQLQSQNLVVVVWTIDRLEDMRTLRSWGVDGLTSNRADLFDQV